MKEIHPLGNPNSRMNIRTGIVTAMLAVSLVSPIIGGTVDESYEIGIWSGFRSAAISYTFDDGAPNQFSIAVPMFNAADMKMTLFSVTEGTWGFSGWERLQTAAAFGHEIASHTETHTSLSTLSDQRQTDELQGSKESINQNISGQTGLTLAYPNCVTGNDAIVSANYIAARVCSQQVVPSTPPDFLRISSYICGTEGFVKTLADFQFTASAAELNGGWAVYLLHAIDDDNFYSPMPSETLQASVDFFGENRDTYWIQTFGNVVRYIRERDDASVVEVSASGTQIALQVTDTLDNAIYDFPITVKRRLPSGWSRVKISQGDTSVNVEVITVDSVKYAMFDIVPDTGEVTIERVEQKPELTLSPTEDGNKLTLRLEDPSGSQYLIKRTTDFKVWERVEPDVVTAPIEVIVTPEGESEYYQAELVE